MDTQQLDQVLAQLVADDNLSKNERRAFSAFANDLDAASLNYLRNRAFALAKAHIAEQQPPLQVLDWLESLIKKLSHQDESLQASAYFSPGEDVRQRLLVMCKHAQRTLDVCVFTISDNTLSSALLEAFQRGVEVRIITDDEKSHDKGSDIRTLRKAGIRVRMDNDPAHMHHKFVIRDGVMLASGSFNWTRSATTRNNENIIVTNQPQLVQDFQAQFETLWQQFGPH